MPDHPPVRRSAYPDADLDEIVQCVGDRWAALRDARILVTGASGFVGGWLLDSLARARRDHGLRTEAVVVTRDRARLAARRPWIADASWVHVIIADVRDLRVGGDLTHVIHCASAATPEANRDDPAGVCDLIVRGTARVMEVARACRAGRVLHLSSGAVHRSPLAAPPLDPETAAADAASVSAADLFGHAKRLAEAIALRGGPNGEPGAIAARCFALLGPGLPLDGTFAAGNFVRDLLTGGPITVHGDGRARRTYLHAIDLAVWCWVLLLEARGGTAWDVGGTEEVSVGELAERVAACRGGVRVQVQGAVGHGPPDRYVPDVRPAAHALGLTPRISLGDALRRTIAWYPE